MTYSPPGAFDPPHLEWIHTYSEASLGVYAKNTTSLSVADRTWVTNLSVLVPFCVDTPSVAKKMWYYGGGSASGNVDIGIYNESGTLLVSSGSTSHGAFGQNVDITDTTLAPGFYYMAIAKDGTTLLGGSAPAVAVAEAIGVCNIASNFPLANGTPAVASNALLPNVGVLLRATNI